MTYYVYIIESETSQKWYVGFTSHLKGRPEDHNNRSTCPADILVGGFLLASNHALSEGRLSHFKIDDLLPFFPLASHFKALIIN